MNDLLLKIYSRLPHPARALTANLRGAMLASWRYGPETEDLIAAAAERESWGVARWSAWREERLARILHRAATRVPFYRAQWEERRRRGDWSSVERLENWPVLGKETVREAARHLVADDVDRRRMYHEQTSGTTGTPIDLWWSRDDLREWFALNELRCRRWHGVNRFQPWAILGGQPIVPATRQRPPFWIWSHPTRQLYLSANHISRNNLLPMIEAMNRHGVTHLITYSSAAAAMVREADGRDIRIGSLRVVITNAEPLYQWQREAIAGGLGAPARETYGMAEAVAAASECADGRLHLWPEVGAIEILDDLTGEPTPEGESGQLVCTGMINQDMPLIRYSVGDRTRFESSNSRCTCGRLLPLLSAIEGRASDMLRTRDGRHIYWINPIFRGLPLHEAQVIQESPDRLRIRCVPAAGFGLNEEARLIERLRQRIGDVHVIIEHVASIPRGPNGKFRPVINKINGQPDRSDGGGA